MAKREAASHANAANRAETFHKIPNELLRRLAAEFRRKFEQKDSVHPEFPDFTDLLVQRVDQRRRAFRSHNTARMSIERYRDGKSVVLSRIENCLPYYLLMAEMNPIEHSDR